MVHRALPKNCNPPISRRTEGIDSPTLPDLPRNPGVRRGRAHSSCFACRGKCFARLWDGGLEAPTQNRVRSLGSSSRCMVDSEGSCAKRTRDPEALRAWGMSL